MAISAYVGLPGHGKSYGVVENVIIPALKSKRMVFTNIPMITDKCLNDFGSEVIPFATEDITKNPKWFTDIFISGSVLVLDEVWRLWPAGLKANNALESHKAFLSEHRHMVGENGFSTEVYLVTQDLSLIASFARNLVDTTYRMVKRSNIGFDKRFRVDVYSGPVTGPKPPRAAREREIHGGKFSEEIYKYYKSHTKSETGLAGDETRVDGRYNSFGRLSIKLGFLFFIIAVPLLIYGCKAFFAKSPLAGAKPVAASPVVESGSSPGAAPVARPGQPVKPPVSEVPNFLGDAKAFYVSMTIQTNRTLDIYFHVDFGSEYRVTLTTRDLQKLGYKIIPINICTVRVQGHDYNGYALCAKPGEKPGMIEKMVAGTVRDK